MTKSIQIGGLGAAPACSRRRCAEDPAAVLGQLCGQADDGEPARYGCGQQFCLWHLHHVVTRDGEDIRLCARCERTWNRARGAGMMRAWRGMRPPGIDPRTIFAILVAIGLGLPVIAAWPSPSGLAIAAVMAVVIFRYGP